MRFRLGVLIGGAVGYVLGARAGRHRYEQLMSKWEQVRSHPTAAEFAGRATDLADTGRKVVSSGLRQGSDKLRDVGNDTKDPSA